MLIELESGTFVEHSLVRAIRTLKPAEGDCCGGPIPARYAVHWGESWIEIVECRDLDEAKSRAAALAEKIRVAGGRVDLLPPAGAPAATLGPDLHPIEFVPGQWPTYGHPFIGYMRIGTGPAEADFPKFEAVAPDMRQEPSPSAGAERPGSWRDRDPLL